MKIALIHLSDFHIKAGEHFLTEKVEGFVAALNTLGEIDEYTVVFSGDLAYSGKVNEYKTSRKLLSRLIGEIKVKNKNKYVDLFLVPGNHDLNLPKTARTRRDIQSHYDDGSIESILDAEFSYLDNFYAYGDLSGKIPYDKLLCQRFRTYGDYKIQFNLINSSLFSTLEPNDKELHYFPNEKMYQLKKATDANICVTVMHHSWEWFNWHCKDDLTKTIIDNSELLLTGHDHQEHSSVVSIDNSLDTWISSAGEMNFSLISQNSSFNVIVIDTDTNSFDGYIFKWNIDEKIYTHKIVTEKRTLQSHSTHLSPLPSYTKSLKEDPYNSSDDFTKYFVLPKLVSEQKNEFGKREEIKNDSELISFIESKKKVFITGATNSGKTTLMKYIYLLLKSNKVPLLLNIDSKTKIKKHTFIRHLFEEQYGESQVLFERYKQLDKNQKVILIDSWDLLPEKSRDSLISYFEQEFSIIVFGSSSSVKKSNMIDSIKEQLLETETISELHIKPFFTEKRNQLVENICKQNQVYGDDNIYNVNRLMDALIHNNSGLFSLNPAFIVRYTNYFILDPYHDYVHGEAVFSKIFEFELNRSIINLSKRSSVDEIFVTFEEIAGFMYTSRKDVLQIEDIRNIVDQYNSNYGVKVNARDILDIGLKAKVLKQAEDLSVYFYNKNHLAYFIAKYLIRNAQNEPYDYSGIKYALENICFGINSDIILFISYLLNNTQNVLSIVSEAGKLLEPWTEVSIDEKNISLLHMTSNVQISLPSEKEKKQIDVAKEYSEEVQYSEDVIEAKGLFEYNDDEIDELPNRLIRAIKYTEMICKALPSFYSSLKMPQKQELVKAIYSYPRKIIYAMLSPVDTHIDKICEILLAYTDEMNITKENGSKYSKADIIDMFNDNARAEFLSIFDHFAEIVTSSKTVSLLLDKDITDSSERIQRLLIIESSGNTDMLLKESEKMLKETKSDDVKLMVKLIVRKHIICNRGLPRRKKQQLIDKIFGQKTVKQVIL